MLHLKHGFVWLWKLDTSKVDKKYLESLEMWWRRIENVIWADRVRNDKYFFETRRKEHPTCNKNKKG